MNQCLKKSLIQVGVQLGNSYKMTKGGPDPGWNVMFHGQCWIQHNALAMALSFRGSVIPCQILWTLYQFFCVYLTPFVVGGATHFEMNNLYTVRIMYIAIIWIADVQCWVASIKFRLGLSALQKICLWQMRVQVILIKLFRNNCKVLFNTG